MQRKTVKRALAWAVAVAVVLGLAAMIFAPTAVEVDVATVERGPLEVTLDHEGKTRVRERFVVSAPVDGQILRIELEPGDPVQAGKTALVTFLPAEPAPLDARTRSELRARVEAARASLEQAEAERQRAEAERDFAATEHRRTNRLAETGLATREALDASETRARSGRDAAQAAQAAVRAAEGELQAARARLEIGPTGSTKPDRQVLTLRSPADGVILRRMHESQTVVRAGEPLLELGDPSRLEVVADYLSRDAVRIRPGMPARIEKWGGDRPLSGTVSRVEPSGVLKVSALGVEEQRVNVIVAFQDPRTAWKALGDAYRVETRIVIWREADVLKAPSSSLFRHGEGWALFRVRDGKARLATVEVGERGALEAQILSGASAGDTVIAYPSDTVSDGTRVSPRGP